MSFLNTFSWSPVIYAYITTYYYHEGYTQLLIIKLHLM
uniref:Uncharacterized protein n=1 Tax=Lepeophtheirus salmonis TaxID=72036 RepID=A0A0K2VJ76_LEPSM